MRHMGLVMRDGINRCAMPRNIRASTPHLRQPGPRLWRPEGSCRSRPREMSRSDLIVIWGTNAVNTRVKRDDHAIRARKERGAKIAAVDVYMTARCQADLRS